MSKLQVGERVDITTLDGWDADGTLEEVTDEGIIISGWRGETTHYGWGMIYFVDQGVNRFWSYDETEEDQAST